MSETTTVIVALMSDGYLTWTNAAVGATCTVERATTLEASNAWVSCVQQPATAQVVTVRVFDPAPPDGMVFVPGGMNCGGDPDSGDYTLEVDPFYMDRTEVTKALWDEVYDWAVTNGYDFDNGGAASGANYPVHTVNWYDCVKWCNARSEKCGFAPVYFTSSGTSVVYRSGRVLILNNCADWGSNGYRLPTSEQFVYAAKGGQLGRRFPWGDTISHSQANYFSESYIDYDNSPTRGPHPLYGSSTSPVGAFPPNGYGLYEMAGNAEEWSWSYWTGFENSGRLRCGGSWGNNARGCRSARVANGTPLLAGSGTGFRSVLPAAKP